LFLILILLPWPKHKHVDTKNQKNLTFDYLFELCFYCESFHRTLSRRISHVRLLANDVLQPRLAGNASLQSESSWFKIPRIVHKHVQNSTRPERRPGMSNEQFLTIDQPYIRARQDLGEIGATHFFGSGRRRSNGCAEGSILIGEGENFILPIWQSLCDWKRAPDRLVVVMADLITESVADLITTLMWLKDEYRGSRSEVIVWANSAAELAGDHYWDPEQILSIWAEAIVTADTPKASFRLRLAHCYRRNPNEMEAQFTVRADPMDEIILEAAPRGLPTRLKIVWVDLDSPARKPGSLIRAELALDRGLGQIVKIPIRYMGHSPASPPNMSPESLVAWIYGEALFRAESNLAPHHERIYPEEHGTVLRLDRYAAAGGISFEPLVGENKGLLPRMAGVDAGIPLLYHVPEAWIGSDNRRFRELARFIAADELPKSVVGPDYMTATTMMSSAPQPMLTRQITTDEVRRMVLAIEGMQVERTGILLSQAQKYELEIMIRQCGFPTDGSTAPLVRTS
jgi:hypothetical protein